MYDEPAPKYDLLPTVQDEGTELLLDRGLGMHYFKSLHLCNTKTGFLSLRGEEYASGL